VHNRTNVGTALSQVTGARIGAFPQAKTQEEKEERRENATRFSRKNTKNSDSGEALELPRAFRGLTGGEPEERKGNFICLERRGSATLTSNCTTGGKTAEKLSGTESSGGMTLYGAI